jgi:hypothetical protein
VPGIEGARFSFCIKSPIAQWHGAKNSLVGNVEIIVVQTYTGSLVSLLSPMADDLATLHLIEIHAAQRDCLFPFGWSQ